MWDSWRVTSGQVLVPEAWMTESSRPLTGPPGGRALWGLGGRTQSQLGVLGWAGERGSGAKGRNWQPPPRGEGVPLRRGGSFSKEYNSVQEPQEVCQEPQFWAQILGEPLCRAASASDPEEGSLPSRLNSDPE